MATMDTLSNSKNKSESGFLFINQVGQQYPLAVK